MLWAAFFCTMFGFYFANSWTPTLLETSGLSREQSANLGMMVALGGAVGSVLFGLCASRWAARTVLVCFLLFSAATMTVLIAATALMPVAFVIGILIGALINGCIAGLYTLAPAQYGPRLRSTGVGWAIGVGRAGAILAPLAAGACWTWPGRPRSSTGRWPESSSSVRRRCSCCRVLRRNLPPSLRWNLPGARARRCAPAPPGSTP
ncbi:MFS transporter [Nesterenkonia sp. PF2B19]|uniref:MFS transporter n=1 Tax=Nesterenkonia sp. PF2B19 TaxID=1881858 RepID=UPI00235116B4|nr:MFS transporter [Nesterenkonia sp. PF2B19]